MGILDLRWTAFDYCNYNKTVAFEDMCRRLFTAKYLKNTEIPHTDHNTPGIEVIPVLEPVREDGMPRKRISFQSKYCNDISNAYKLFQKSADIIVNKWQGKLDVVYLFSNQTLTTTSARYKEITETLNNANIEVIPISNTDLLDLAAEFPQIAIDFFNIDDSSVIGSSGCIPELFWNAGKLWYEEMRKPGARFYNLKIVEQILPSGTNEPTKSEYNFPFKATDANEKNIQYEIIDPNSYNDLDLSVCDNNILVYVTITLDEES